MEKQGLLIVGRLHSSQERSAVLGLIKKLNWPVYVDINSGLRLGQPHTNIIHYFDLLLGHRQIQEMFTPEIVIQLGGKITSKRLYKHLKTTVLKHYFIIDKSPTRVNPEHIPGHQLEVDIVSFSNAITSKILGSPGSEKRTFLREVSNKIDHILNDTINTGGVLTEPAVARLISQHIPKNTGLFIASSMPIRNMNLFSAGNGCSVQSAANRGASGIDGTLASAIGFANGLQQTTTILIGDLALLHDLNSLALITSPNLHLIIVVINNNGGGIFSFLPIVKYKSIFDAYFGTPHDLNFKYAAKMFGLSYENPATQESFVEMYRNALMAKKSFLIEITIDRQLNTEFHKKITQKVFTELQ